MRELIFADGYDAAILGVVDRFDLPRVVYSKRAMIDILIEEGMTLIDAIQHLEYNVWNAYVSNKGPVYVDDLDSLDRTTLVEYVFG